MRITNVSAIAHSWAVIAGIIGIFCRQFVCDVINGRKSWQKHGAVFAIIVGIRAAAQNKMQVVIRPEVVISIEAHGGVNTIRLIVKNGAGRLRRGKLFRVRIRGSDKAGPHLSSINARSNI